jgi:C4-dicarboxylate transporter DctM subunit
MSAVVPGPGPVASSYRWPALIPPVLIAIPVVLKLAGVPINNAWIVFALLFGLMLTGMPVSISLGLTVLTYLFTMTTVPIESVALKLFTGIERFEIMAIPFFILAGNFLTHGGVARRMINFAAAMISHWHGGLGLAGVMACALFAAVSGSSPATVVAIGAILLPAMIKQGFPPRFGAGVITTSGALGILIPPSIVMVMYAVATNTSVGALFIAGIIPGLVLATLLGLTTWYRARKNNYPRQPRASWAVRWATFRESIWGLLLVIVVIGGIYSGIFTPTEAAAMSAVYAFFVAVFVYKDMSLAQVPKVLLDSANMSAMLLYIITNAVMFSYLMTSEQIPQELAAWMLDKGLGVVVFLLFVNVILLLAGNVMEPSSIVLIMAPILFPVAMKLGIDPVHFGIIMVVNMEVGMCHPPVGLNLYVASGITKMGITELTIAVWPWLLTMLGFLVIVTYWPMLSIWLPQTLGMMRSG